jgi:ABC-type uncharacterized transport system YnjBCD ATPase subunit
MREILSSHRVNQILIILRYGVVFQDELLFPKDVGTRLLSNLTQQATGRHVL